MKKIRESQEKMTKTIEEKIAHDRQPKLSSEYI